MIIFGQEIPDIWDVKDEDSLRRFLIAVKLCIEELGRKAQSVQMTTRTTIPSADDIQEKEFVIVNTGGSTYIYSKIEGVVKKWQNV